MIIEEVKEALPDIKIMIMEPFLLKGSASEEKWELFRSGVEEKAAASRRIAEKYNLKFVELMHKFDEVYETEPMGYWLSDGVHPTSAGHELIKREWLKAFKEL